MRGLWQRLCDRVLEDTSTSGRKFSALDGLRGVAVLTVFLSHSSGFRQRLTPWTSFHGCGHLGVYLFFVLSGFLLASSLLASRQIRVGGFYLRRFFRIAPLYYLVVSAVFLCQQITGQMDLYNLHVKGGWLGYVRHLLFYQGDSVFWTIAAEFEFYFLIPLVVFVLMRGGRRAAVILLVAALGYGAWGMAIEFGWLVGVPPLKVARIVHQSQYFDVFLLGILAAWVGEQAAFKSWWSQHGVRTTGLICLALVGLGVASLICVAEQCGVFHREWFALRHLTLLYALVFAGATLASLTPTTLLATVLNWSWLRLIGVTGFSWYLIHFPILRFSNWAFHHAPTAGAPVPWSLVEPMKLTLSFVLTSVAATILYLSVEKPFMLLSKTFLQRKPSGVATNATI